MALRSLFLFLIALRLPICSQSPPAMAQSDPTRAGLDRDEPIRVTGSIWLAVGFGNTFLIQTSAGNILVDTSLPNHAVRHKKMLDAAAPGAIRYIILTHAHGDHTGGVPLWRQPGTQIVAQRNHVEFRHYQARLAGFFASRNSAQFGPGIGAIPRAGDAAGNYPARIDATILFAEKHEFELGGLKVEVHHTPGETDDHLSVWIPQWRAAFVGDNIYDSFPNIYTLRGTKPRWALDYVRSLEQIQSWAPEILLPSHGNPIHGRTNIDRAIGRYRDAILHVHDATVKGMNEGKDVFSLMREIRLPPELELGEGYGNIPWSVRGIYEGYAGWFDGNPAAMYAVPPQAVYPDLVLLAGGAGAVAALGRQRLEERKLTEALHLADIARSADPASRAALDLRLAALEALLQQSRNSNEAGWLRQAIAETRAAR